MSTASKTNEISLRQVARAFGAGGVYAAMIVSVVGIAIASAKTGVQIAAPILQAELVRIHDGKNTAPARDKERSPTLVASLAKP